MEETVETPVENSQEFNLFMRVMEGESETTLDGNDSSSPDIVEVSTQVVNELVDLESSAYDDISLPADSDAEDTTRFKSPYMRLWHLKPLIL